MAKPLTNLQDSVRQRLLNLAKTKQQPFDVVLVKYGIERVLLRLAGSEHRNRFVLKGGLLVTIWIDDLMRVTRDVDFLGYGDDDAETLKTVFKEILSIDLKDGLAFDVESLTAQPIREEAEYGGTRLKTTAYLANTRIPITIDIGFGDAVVPAVEEIDYPHLLDAEVTSVRAYPPATVIAEKFQAIIALGMINGRMKDYYDLWAIPQSVIIAGDALDAAIKATFDRRGTPVPNDIPPGLSEAFYTSPEKIRQWDAYARSINFSQASLGFVGIHK